MSDLMDIGIRINKAIGAVWNSGLSIKELEEFEAYLNHQETIVPLVDPTFIVKHGFKYFNQARERIKLLRPIIELQEKEREGK